MPLKPFISSRKLRPITRRGKVILYGLMWLYMVNFVLKLVFYFYFGGDSVNGGYIRDGHYFLWMKEKPEHYTEVSKQVWNLITIQNYSLFAVLILLFISICILRKTGDLE